MSTTTRPEHAATAPPRSGASLSIRALDGSVATLGDGPAAGEVVVRTHEGTAALRSLSELAICEAYIAGHLDFDGDLIAAMGVRDVLRDDERLIRWWARLAPLVLGRKRLNPGWIAKHYDSGNVQLHALDDDFRVYTPGSYAGEDDTLEAGAERKLAAAYEALGLGPGARLLDVGCGWGGWLRYCARRGVRGTGISLSRHQLAYAGERMAAEDLEADLRYADFFSFEPEQPYDAISLMGVFEDLSDYDRALRRVAGWLAPGGRIYCDFAAADRRVGIASFVTKHVWPGTFRMVYMPEFMSALAAAGLDLASVSNDRHNYHLWAVKSSERWLDRHDAVVAESDEATWRLMRVLFAGTAHIMAPGNERATAYRLLLAPRAVM